MRTYKVTKGSLIRNGFFMILIMCVMTNCVFVLGSGSVKFTNEWYFKI